MNCLLFLQYRSHCDTGINNASIDSNETQNIDFIFEKDVNSSLTCAELLIVSSI